MIKLTKAKLSLLLSVHELCSKSTGLHVDYAWLGKLILLVRIKVFFSLRSCESELRFRCLAGFGIVLWCLRLSRRSGTADHSIGRWLDHPRDNLAVAFGALVGKIDFA